VDLGVGTKRKELQKDRRAGGCSRENEIAATSEVVGGIKVKPETDNSALCGGVKPILHTLVLAIETTGGKFLGTDHADKTIPFLREMMIALAAEALGEEEGVGVVTVGNAQNRASRARTACFIELAFDRFLGTIRAFAVDQAAFNKTLDTRIVHGKGMGGNVAEYAVVRDRDRIVMRRNGWDDEAAGDRIRRLGGGLNRMRNPIIRGGAMFARKV